MYQREWETGIYYDPDTADRTVAELHAMGYTPEEISVIMRDERDAEKFAQRSGTKVGQGAGTGAVVGGGIGAIVAGILATGSIVATGGAAAPIVVGPLAAVLAGVGAGGVAGGIVGGLIGLGIPEHKAREYEAGLNRGGIIIGVQAREEDRARVNRLLSAGDRDVPTTRSDV
ncbi:MAG TPA: general stress protein [Candidatus Acidoferrales bacterium]|nr:general stress protein [Candidatus Acidoferrales bacterium]